MSAALLPDVIRIGKMAGKAIMQIYNSNNPVSIQTKQDNSPVTVADIKSQEIIVSELKKLTPDVPIISEEDKTEATYQTRKSWDRLWLIDPLDGTKEFLQRTDEFTVNIALVEKSEPVLGVVVVPTMDVIYFAACKHNAYKKKGDLSPEVMHIANGLELPVRVTISRNHSNEAEVSTLLAQLGEYRIIECGSTLKLCLVAEGTANIYPRIGPTKEWDTAAGQCVLEAAGGIITDLCGNRLSYNKKSLLNPSFIAYSHLEIFNKLKF